MEMPSSVLSPILLLAVTMPGVDPVHLGKITTVNLGMKLISTPGGTALAALTRVTEHSWPSLWRPRMLGL